MHKPCRLMDFLLILKESHGGIYHMLLVVAFDF